VTFAERRRRSRLSWLCSVLYPLGNSPPSVDLALFRHSALLVVVGPEQLPPRVHAPSARPEQPNIVMTLLHRFRLSVRINSITAYNRRNELTRLLFWFSMDIDVVLLGEGEC
jgi:hypothetical protein